MFNAPLKNSYEVAINTGMISAMQDIFTVSQVAEKLKISVARVRVLCAKWGIGCKPNERIRLLTAEEVKRLQRRNTKPGPAKKNHDKKPARSKSN